MKKVLILFRDPDGCYYVANLRDGTRGPRCNSATKAIRRYRAKGLLWSL